MTLEENLRKIRENSPLIHNITNYVVMNSTANALLAIGASPVMAHAVEEVQEMVSISSALVINMGTLSSSSVDAMELAMQRAVELNIPIVYDPVGAGATSYRNKMNSRLLTAAAPTIIRGNGSEIMALADSAVTTKGVDSTAKSVDALSAAKTLTRRYGSVVVISGAIDYIVSGEEVIENRFGTPLMTRITGMGCTCTVLCAAFVAVNPQYPAEAAYHAMTLMGQVGEQSHKETQLPGNFQTIFIDNLYKAGRKQD